nr:MAG TPA: hypothetical protein [Caudoviricetes sp.]
MLTVILWLYLYVYGYGIIWYNEGAEVIAWQLQRLIHGLVLSIIRRVII